MLRLFSALALAIAVPRDAAAAPAAIDAFLNDQNTNVAPQLGAYVARASQRRAVALVLPPLPLPAAALPAPVRAATDAPVPTVRVSAEPTAMPTPAPVAHPNYDRYVAVDLTLAPRVSNEFASRSIGRVAQDISAGLEYKFLGRNFVEFEYRRMNYDHGADLPAIPNGTPCRAVAPPPGSGDRGCVTTIGGRTSAYVDPLRLREERYDLRTSLIGTGRAYLATSTLRQHNNYGYPNLNANLGFGAELLPRLERPASIGAAYFYYPEFGGTYSPPGAPALRLRYKLQTFAVRAQLAITGTPLFVEVGFFADHAIGKQNAPANVQHRSALLGFGLHR